MSQPKRPLPPLEGLLRAVPVGLVLLDREGHVVLYNDAEARLSGRSPDSVEGRSFFDEAAPWNEVRQLEETFRLAMESERPLDEDRELVFAAAGGVLDVRVRMRSVTLDGEPYAVLLIDDNSRFKAAERLLAGALNRAQDQATRDPLTGLFNRRHLEAVLPGELKRAERLGAPLSLFVLDVDHFKKINDTFGHPMGDRVLVELARLLNRILRVGDTCARLGGEEFCVVLPHTDVRAAAQAAERLHRVIRALRFEEVPDLRVRVSIGATTALSAERLANAEEEMRVLFARADGALYDAKRSGRDRTVQA